MTRHICIYSCDAISIQFFFVCRYDDFDVTHGPQNNKNKKKVAPISGHGDQQLYERMYKLYGSPDDHAFRF